MKRKLSLLGGAAVLPLLLAVSPVSAEDQVAEDVSAEKEQVRKAGDTAAKATFVAIDAPATAAEKRKVLTSPEFMMDGKVHKIGFNTLARSGDKLGDHRFGLLTDEKGNPVVYADGSEAISDSNDFMSFHDVNGKLYSVAHFESRPGAMYISEMSKDVDTGALSYTSTKPIDFSEWGGLWVPCAGMVTPWKTHMGSEEYEPDARLIADAKSYEDIDDYYKPMLRYFGLDPEKASLEDFRKSFNPYTYGYATEVAVQEDGTPKVTKHYAVGRVAHEVPYVMPDKKTVIFSDDGTNVGLYMFVADAEGKLDAGTLYAMKWNQTSAENGGAADLEWIDLGHATFDEVKKAIDEGVGFYDMFEAAAFDEEKGCPDGFTSINTTAGVECVKVKDGMDAVASRLETRRYAALKGATTELRKEEGITYDPKSNRLFVAMSEIARGMEDNMKNGKPTNKYDVGGPNDVKLPYNLCGAVYALDLKESADINTKFMPVNMKAIVAGTMKSYGEDSKWANNTCDLDGIANPDNVTMMPGQNILVIGEDTGSGHQNDAVWAYNMDAGELTRIATTPYGSETTSPYVYQDLRGHGYMAFVVQHPYGESDEDKMESPDQARAYTGYIGPFPVLGHEDASDMTAQDDSQK